MTKSPKHYKLVLLATLTAFATTGITSDAWAEKGTCTCKKKGKVVSTAHETEARCTDPDRTRPIGVTCTWKADTKKVSIYELFTDLEDF